MKGEQEMEDNKKVNNGFMKKGLILCLAGAMAFGMMACGSGGKKKDSTQTKMKTESNRIEKKEQDRTSKTDATRPESSAGMKKQDDKSNATRPESNAGMKKQDDKANATRLESSAGMKKQDDKANAEQPKSSAGTKKQKDSNTKKNIKDIQDNKLEGNSSKIQERQ